jgi:hypothetical protein
VRFGDDLEAVIICDRFVFVNAKKGNSQLNCICLSAPEKILDFFHQARARIVFRV